MSNNLSANFNEKALGLIDREKETKQLLYALLTGEHLLLMGPAGTAKSLFASNAFSAIDKAKTFKIHLTKQTTEEYVFGPLNISELKKGNIKHNTKDSILDADFAFIDEFFDASDVLLRSLLGVLNERTWMKGSQKIKAKLHTAVLTSNYQRQNEITTPILDRIIFKAKVNPIASRVKRIKVYKNFISDPNFVPKKIIDLDEIIDFNKKVESNNSVKFSKEWFDLYDRLLEEYRKESKKYISQRTANKALKVIKAVVLLNKRSEAEYEDLEELKYVFCTLNERIEEEYFDAVYEKCVGNIAEELAAEKSLERIEKEITLLPQDFKGFDDQMFIEKMRDLNMWNHMLTKMENPSDKITRMNENLKSKVKQLMDNNRDKLFSKKNEK